MNILLIGSGGREHTLAWKLKQSPLCDKLFIAPGNAGTAAQGTNLDITLNDFESHLKACIKHKIDMVLVGPEEPLVNGIVDFFKNHEQSQHIQVIGPSANAAQLEGSKAYAKDFMNRHGIPTAAYKEFTAENYAEGVDYIKQQKIPVVLKADGLAAGKGVLICQSHVEALAEFELIILKSKFGEAGNRVVVEEFLTGMEMSVFILTDGINYVLLPEAKDYKRIGEGDTGLNTGGMGAISPLPFFDEPLKQKIICRIIEPTIAGLQKDKLDYKGFVFIGLILVNSEPMVIEYNCRLGDPETEVVITRIENDLVEMLLATAESRVNEIQIKQNPETALAVVAVSGGYPGVYEKGRVISGLDTDMDNCMFFHAGTAIENKKIVSNGGRVLVGVSFGHDIKEAVDLSEYLMQQVYFEDMKYRADIGWEFKSPPTPQGGI